MPISPIVVQRRQAELGRIRLGQKQTTSNGKTRPAKLDRFRFTSVSEQYIRDLAELYGGTAQKWDNNGVASWEVVSEATSIPVIVVKNGLSQWMETWSGGGCIHRCDGERQVDGTLCNPEDRDHVNAKPTTRLSVMLPELDAIGSFRMETHGWNAAAEIPAVAELAQYVGDLVPAILHLVERRAIKDGKTSRFVVPVLDLKIGAGRLREIVAQKAGLELESGQAPSGAAAIESGRPNYQQQADTATTVDDVRDIWNAAKDAGHLDEALKTGLSHRVNELQADAPAAVEAAKPKPTEPLEDEDGAVPAELVDEDIDAIWQKCLKRAGELHISLWDLEKDLKEMTGVPLHEANAEILTAYLGDLEGRDAA